MIWAGVAYDAAGRVIEDLDLRPAAFVDRKPPLRIIRHSERPRVAEPAPLTPRRRLVLARGVQSAGPVRG